MLTQHFHEVGIAVPVDVVDDAEDPLLRVDGSQRTIVRQPHLGEIVSHEPIAGHGGGGLAASTGSGTTEIGYSSARSVEPGDEHVLGELLTRPEIGREIDGESVVPLLHEQGISGIGAEHRVGGEPRAIHKDSGMRKILNPPRTLRVEVGEEEPGFLDLLVKGRVRIPVEHVRAVHDIGGARDLDCRNGGRGTRRPTIEKADEQYLACHHADHFVLDVGVGVVAQYFLGEHADLLVGVDDVEGPVDDARLLLGEVEVDGVIGHGQRALFTLGDAQLADGLQIGLAPTVDHHPIRTAHRNRVGDFEKRLLGGDSLELCQLGLTHFRLEKRPGVVYRLNTTDALEDFRPLAEFKH